jgi:hypothetical protein
MDLEFGLPGIQTRWGLRVWLQTLQRAARRTLAAEWAGGPDARDGPGAHLARWARRSANSGSLYARVVQHTAVHATHAAISALYRRRHRSYKARICIRRTTHGSTTHISPGYPRSYIRAVSAEAHAPGLVPPGEPLRQTACGAGHSVGARPQAVYMHAYCHWSRTRAP